MILSLLLLFRIFLSYGTVIFASTGVHPIKNIIGIRTKQMNQRSFGTNKKWDCGDTTIKQTYHGSLFISKPYYDHNTVIDTTNQHVIQQMTLFRFRGGHSSDYNNDADIDDEMVDLDADEDDDDSDDNEVPRRHPSTANPDDDGDDDVDDGEHDEEQDGGNKKSTSNQHENDEAVIDALWDDNPDMETVSFDDESTDNIQFDMAEQTLIDDDVADDDGNDEANDTNYVNDDDDDHYNETQENMFESSYTTTNESGSEILLSDIPSIDENDNASYADGMALADANDEVDDVIDASLNTNHDVIETSTATSSHNDPRNETDSSSLESFDETTRQILHDELHYRKHEIDVIKPEIAQTIVANKLFRPSWGIPEHWKRFNAHSNTTSFMGRYPMIRSFRRLIPVILMGILCVTQGPTVLATIASKQRTSSPKITPKLTIAEPNVVSDESIAESVSGGSGASTISSNVTSADENLHLDEVESVYRPHSIKPGMKQQTVQQYENDLDITWLDKILTKIKKKIKAILQWEL